MNPTAYKYVHRSRRLGTPAEHWDHAGPAAAARRFPRTTSFSRLFVQTLAPELDLDPILGPILRGAAVASGRLVDRNCASATDPARTLKGGTFLLRCGLLYRCERQRCGPPLHPRRRAGAGGLRAGALRLPLRPAAGTLLRAKTGSLVRRLAFWMGKDIEVAEYFDAHARRASAPMRRTAARAGSSIPCRCRRCAAV